MAVVLVLAVAIALGVLSNAPTGSAGGNVITSSGAGGKIVFTSDRDGNNEIYVMNADGSGQTRLTNNAADDSTPAWSPDGTQIAFTSDRDGNNEIYVMNADGSGQINLTNNPEFDGDPDWSPDGGRIAFWSTRDVSGSIYVMNADGSDQIFLTAGVSPDWSPDGSRIAYERSTLISGPPSLKTRLHIWTVVLNGSGATDLSALGNPGEADYFSPAWSPDGARIAYQRFGFGPGQSGIYVMNADGSGVTLLATLDPFTDLVVSRSLAWSPDGSRIAFTSNRDDQIPCFPTCNEEIYVINTDGSGQTNLTNNPAKDSDPDWLSLTPTGPSVSNPPSSSLIVVDGQFGPPSAEWLDITPLLFLDGASIVYTGLDSDASAIYLMYDLGISTKPLEIGETGGPVTFEGVCGGVSGVFSVLITQGGANTGFGPGHASTSEGGIGDTVDVSFNGEPALPGSLCNPIIDPDEGEDCIEGAVDHNSTSPNFPFPHNLFELEICLLTTPDTPGGFSNGVYSPDPSFWGADLPTDGGTIVSESIVDIKTVDDVTGVTEVIPLIPAVTPSPTPSPTPAPATLIWGDHNCSGSADPIDSLLTLRHDAGLGANTGDCPDFGQVVDVQFASPHPWGDVDCGGEVTPVDSLKLLRYDAGLGVTQEADCPEMGTSVTIVEG